MVKRIKEIEFNADILNVLQYLYIDGEKIFYRVYRLDGMGENISYQIEVDNPEISKKFKLGRTTNLMYGQEILRSGDNCELYVYSLIDRR